MFRTFLKLVIGLIVMAMALSLLAKEAQAAPPTYLPYQAGSAYRVTQGNGGGYSHSDQYNRYAWDFAMATGTPVIAAAPGTVSFAGWDSTGFGYSVRVCYGDGTCSRYAHLSQVAVSRGQRVGQAQLIGRAGSTGRSSAPHLHYGLETSGGRSVGSRFAEAGIPRAGDRPVSHNRPGPSAPRFDEVRVYSSPMIEVAAGDAVGAAVTARYLGPAPIPCGHANLGVRGDGPARFADYAAGWWPASPWRSPNRVAAVGCNGSLQPGQSATWHLRFRVPEQTPAGDYQTAVYSPVWEGVGWADVRFPISLRVRSGLSAGMVDQSVSPITAPGEQGRISVALRNTGRVPWQRGEVNLGVPGDGRFPFADGSWNGAGNRIFLEEATVAPGEVGHFTATYTVPAEAAPGRHRLDLVPVAEHREWFGRELGLYLMVFVGSEQQPPYAAADYDARWVTQTYRDTPLARGESAEVTVTLRNVGWATWFDDGPRPVHFRGIRPNDRGSGFIDPAHPATIGHQGVRLPRDVAPGETVTVTMPIKPAESVPNGSYQEYFRLVAEHVSWFGPDGIWWPFTVR